MTTLVVDGRPDDRELAHLGRVVIPEELGIDAAVLTSMKTIYNVMELSTALKPFLLQHLVREDTYPSRTLTQTSGSSALSHRCSPTRSNRTSF